MKKKFGLLLISILIIVQLTSCIERFTGEETELDDVDIITPEDIESIFASISYEVTERYPTETDISGNKIVFWLKGGSVWHISRACGSIVKADESSVLYGTVSDALTSGKERPCKVCSNNEDVSAYFDENSKDYEITSSNISYENFDTEKYPKEYDQQGEIVVFWVEGGTVWHDSKYCSSLSRTDAENIHFGNISDAIAAGKERACKKCS